MSATKEEIYKVIETEREYQEAKWGPRKHEIPTWLLILRKELDEAEEAWLKKGVLDSIIELGQVLAVGVACMEEHGAMDRFLGSKSSKEQCLSMYNEQRKKY